jgi:hypothetical protein
MDDKVRATEEQVAYAKLLDTGMKAGLLLVMTTFVIYLSGALAPHVPVSDLPKYWGMPVNEYLQNTHIPRGWAWLGMIGKGDFLNFVGIAFLAGITVACFAKITPMLFRKKDFLYGVFAIIEVLVLTLAASGILKAGGH